LELGRNREFDDLISACFFEDCEGMKASDIFGLIVRTLGIVLIIYGIWYIFAGASVWYATHQIAPPPGETQYAYSSYFFTGLPALAGGLICFLFADIIVGWTYRK
jgi:hypothetical protein